MSQKKEELQDFLQQYAQLSEKYGFSFNESEIYDREGTFQGFLEVNYETYDIVLDDMVVASVEIKGDR